MRSSAGWPIITTVHAPLITQLTQGTCGADETGHVNVMSAGMHHGDITTEIIFDGFCARVGQARLFFDWQGVEIGAHEDYGTFTIL
jgi:hypothetical protein